MSGTILVLVVFVALVIPTIKFTIGQAYYEKGKALSLQKQYSRSQQDLQKALSLQPDDPAIQHELGLLHLRLALDMGPMLRGVMASRAAAYFTAAQGLNPLEPETAYFLARASELLGEKYRAQTLAAYGRAVSLWPNNALYRRDLAAELFRQDKADELLASLQVLGTIDPGSYGQLSREPYWSESAREAFAKGVQEAILQNIAPRAAHMTLAAILEKQGDWADATAEYQAAMGFEQHRNTGANDYRLARLLLKSGDTDEAARVLMQGLKKSSTREKDLENLYTLLRDGSDPEEQLAFYRKVRDSFPLSWRLEILVARTLIDAGQYDEARKILEDVALEANTPEPWYWLARIGELTGDWDAMELAIQKASIRESNNSDYHFMFSRALAKQQKYGPAEDQATRAISTREKPSPWLYNHRAWTRWSQKNFEGALEDWQEANRLAPDNAAFYGQIGLAYRKLGLSELATIAYSEALERDPENERYRQELGLQ